MWFVVGNIQESASKKQLFMLLSREGKALRSEPFTAA